MKTTSNLTRLLLTLIACIGFLSFEEIRADDYKQYSKQLREEIWGWQKPEFHNYTVPEKYKNESGVILALHEEIIATGKSKIRFDPNSFFALNKELSYTQIYRRLILLNDKAALEENSEVSFIEQQRSVGFRVATKNRYVVGVRIIKPDGTVREVDMDEAVSVTEGKKEKERYKKLAIPDLQVGDILDYFFYEEGRVDYQNIPPRDFYLSSIYPILSYTIHCEIDKKLTTEYRSVNNAPEFEVTTNEEGDVILDLKSTDLPKREADRWISPLRQFPTVRLAIYFNSNTNIFKPGSFRKGGVYKNISPDMILHDAMGYFAGSNYYMYAYRDIKRKAKKHFQEHSGMNTQVKADYLYYSLLAYANYYENIVPTIFIRTLYKLFDDFKIENKVGFATNRFDARNNEVLLAWDFNPLLIANNGNDIYTAPLRNYYIGNNPYHEGEPIHTVIVKKMNPQSKEGIKGIYGKLDFPVSSAEDNLSKILVGVDFSGDDLLTLIIDREVRLTGYMRSEAYSSLILRSEWHDAVSYYLGEETYLETLEKKNKQKEIESYHASIEKSNKKREENIKMEISSIYDMEPKELMEYSFSKFGITPNDPQMVFKLKYSIDGFVKRAGNNYILDVGKMIGKQAVLNDKERNRNMDSYLPYARNYEHEININIPQGYSVENIDKLNKKVDNEYGRFISTATINGNVLNVKVEKTYKTNYIPVTKWNEMVEVIDEGNDFYAQSVVLRKN